MSLPAIVSVIGEEETNQNILQSLTAEYADQAQIKSWGSIQEAVEWLEDFHLQGGQLLVAITSEFVVAESADDLIPTVNRLYPHAETILVPDSQDISLERLSKWRNVRFLPNNWNTNHIYQPISEALKSQEATTSSAEEKHLLGLLPRMMTELQLALAETPLAEALTKSIFKVLHPTTAYFLATEQGKLAVRQVLSSDPKTQHLWESSAQSAEIHRLNAFVVNLLTEELQKSELNPYRAVLPIYWNGKVNAYLVLDNTDEQKPISRAQREILEVISAFGSQVLEQQSLNKRLAERTKQLSKQKDTEEEQRMVIELIEKELLDQVHFSQSIQESFLAQASPVQDIFPESFLIFQSSNPVSTSFYWLRERYHRFMLSVADCNEPSVSSAFVSLIASYLLDSVTENNAMLSPSEVLAIVNKKLRLWFKQNPNAVYTPLYLNIGLCCIDQPNSELLYAGGGHRLVLVRKGEAMVLEGESEALHVNDPFNEGRLFQLHTLPLEDQDTIYLFSQAWALLFNHSRVNNDPAALVKTVSELHNLSMEEQEKAFLSTIKHWKRDNRLPYDLMMMCLKWSEN